MVHVFFIGWRKISCYFNISYEIRDKNIEFDEQRNVQRAEFVIRAYMQYVSCLVVSINASSRRSKFSPQLPPLLLTFLLH